MPVEIKELVIRAVVESGERSGSGQRIPPDPAAGEDAIVDACVRQVMKILKKSKER